MRAVWAISASIGECTVRAIASNFAATLIAAIISMIGFLLMGVFLPLWAMTLIPGPSAGLIFSMIVPVAGLLGACSLFTLTRLLQRRFSTGFIEPQQAAIIPGNRRTCENGRPERRMPTLLRTSGYVISLATYVVLIFEPQPTILARFDLRQFNLWCILIGFPVGCVLDFAFRIAAPPRVVHRILRGAAFGCWFRLVLGIYAGAQLPATN